MAPPSHNSTASDTVLPGSPLPTDSRTRPDALDPQELDEAGLDDPTQQLVDVFVNRPPDQKSGAADDPDNPANNLQYPEDHPAAAEEHDEATGLSQEVDDQTAAPQDDDPADHVGPDEDHTAVDIEEAAADVGANDATDAETATVAAAATVGQEATVDGIPDVVQSPPSPLRDDATGAAGVEEAVADAPPQATEEAPTTTRKENKQSRIKAEKVHRASRAQAVSGASAAAMAVAVASSGAASATVPSLPLTAGIAHPAAAYPFPGLANGAALMPHPLVSVTTQVGRRAVRIAPMGVLPLPPQNGAGGTALMADLSGAAAGLLGSVTGGPGSGDGSDGMGGVGAVGGSGTGTIGEMRKGKRRGMTGGVSGVIPEGLTAEERTKQKRMLRNRESAARSRDKRKSRNMKLENSIKTHTEKRKTVEGCVEELTAIVVEMKEVLKKHKVEVPG